MPSVGYRRRMEFSGGFGYVVGLPFRAIVTSIPSSPPQRWRTLVAAGVMVVLCALQPALAQGFKFSNPDPIDEQERQEKDAARQQAIDDIWTPCRADLKNKKIMVLIGERQSNGYIAAQQQNYGPHYQAINRRLRELGLLTYTPEEIRRQIAQAEIDAYFRNDPDAALSASKRVGASFVLRGLISAQAMRGHGFHAERCERPADLRRACEHRVVRRRGRVEDGAHARQREGGRSRTQALRRLLPQRRVAATRAVEIAKRPRGIDRPRENMQ
jgi:hypothetical protein